MSQNASVDDLLEICKRRVSATVTREQLNQCGITALQLSKQVARIVERNLASGRARKVLTHQRRGSSEADAQLEHYVDIVIPIYLIEHPRVERLAERSNAEWLRLQK